MIVWLASYPKSGNTWLRSLLATYFFTEDGNFNFNLLKNIDQFPSVNYFKKYDDEFNTPESTSKYWIKEQVDINKDKKLKFLKTHSAMCKINNNSFTNSELTLGAIHIVRDPRNIVSSLAHHYQFELKQALDFMKNDKKALIEKKNERFLGFVPILSWALHEKSWSECKKFPMLTVKYEELDKKPYETFKRVFEFIKKISNIKDNLDEDKLKKTIDSCNFKNLQNLEKKKGFEEAMTLKGSNQKIKFFNLGKDNDYKKLLNEDFVNEISFLYKEQIKKYSYE